MNNFIEQYYLPNCNVCDDIIDFFESSPEKNIGVCQDTAGNQLVDNTYKDCVEIVLDTNQELYWKYVKSLQICCEQYVITHPYSNNYAPWKICEYINVQKYNPGQSFGTYHTERIGRTGIQSSRHLVFMTYLNDIAIGGETEFYHQQLCLQPQRGLTLIWPADWTHTHRGIAAPQETKYIVTGWYNYVD